MYYNKLQEPSEIITFIKANNICRKMLVVNTQTDSLQRWKQFVLRRLLYFSTLNIMRAYKNFGTVIEKTVIYDAKSC
jgi:hypothetical protein